MISMKIRLDAVSIVIYSKHTTFYNARMENKSLQVAQYKNHAIRKLILVPPSIMPANSYSIIDTMI